MSGIKNLINAMANDPSFKSQVRDLGVNPKDIIESGGSLGTPEGKKSSKGSKKESY